MNRIKYFTTDSTTTWKKNYIFFSIIFYALDIVLFLLLGVLEDFGRNLITGLILIVWLLLCLYLFNYIPLKQFTIVAYSLLVALLAIIEETLVYLNGGGLNGTAISLQQDLLLVVPVFVALGFALYFSARYFDLIAPDFYIYGSIYGLLLELIIGQKLAFFYLFGGPALVFYGSMLATFSPKESNQRKKLSINKYFQIILILILMFISMIVGAIIGGMMYKLYSELY